MHTPLQPSDDSMVATRMSATRVMEEIEAPSAAWIDPLAGTPFRMLAALGKGGAGEVVLMEHRTLGTISVAKLLHSNVRGDQMADRFKLEAQALSRIKHPNLVSVTGYDTTPEGRPFIVMEHLEGETLHGRLARAGGGPLPLAESLEICQQICAGLSAVHAAGLVHRDIKPANIFLCKGGVVKVLDLGLAKVVGDGTLTPSPLAAPTATGVIMGTFRYMAPEQIASDGIEPRTDQYAVGCILHRLLTGRGPYDFARGTEAILAAHVLQEPKLPSAHLSAPLPAGLDDLILRCLAKSAADRYADALALREALGSILTNNRVGDAFGTGFITQAMQPSTSMMEPVFDVSPSQPVVVHRVAASPPATAGRTISLNAFAAIMTATILAGIAIGLIVWRAL